MALHFNKLERPGTGLLVIRQTWLEPVLKILSGGAIMGMGVFFMVTATSGVSSRIPFQQKLMQALIIRFEDFLLMFEEGATSNMETVNIVTFVFPFLIALFGMILLCSGIRRLVQPVEHQFDRHKKTYLRNGEIIARFGEITTFDTQRKTSSSGEGGSSTWYQLSLKLKSGNSVKLMKIGSEERARELVREMRGWIGDEPETAGEETGHESSPKSTRPEWFKWLTWPFIGLFIFFWIDGFFDFDLIPEDWKGWMFGVIFAGFVIIILGGAVLGVFGKGGSGGTPAKGGGDFGRGDGGGGQ